MRFTLQSFELNDEGVASLFGLELARLVVDTSFPELMAEQHKIKGRSRTPDIDAK